MGRRGGGRTEGVLHRENGGGGGGCGLKESVRHGGGGGGGGSLRVAEAECEMCVCWGG